MMTPITYANLSGSFFGADFKQFLFDYTHTAAWWAHAEGLPDERNTVTLSPTVKDARGLPVAQVTYAWGDNDVTLAGAARDKAVEMMKASGARHVRPTELGVGRPRVDAEHLVGVHDRARSVRSRAASSAGRSSGTRCPQNGRSSSRSAPGR